MEKTNKLLISGIFLFGLILSLSLIAGAITFISPSTAGDTVNGTWTFNITTTINATDENYYCNLSTSANAQFNSSYNATADAYLGFTISYDTTLLTEAEDTTLTVNCSNSTSSEQGTLTINVDNTDPVCAFSIDTFTTTYLSPIGIETTQSSTDTTDLTYAWVLYDPSGTSQQTSTSSAPTFTGSDFDEKGNFILSLTVTDEASKSTACSNETIFVKSSDGDIASQITTTITEKSYLWYYIIGGVLLIIVMIIVAFYIISKSKK